MVSFAASNWLLADETVCFEAEEGKPIVKPVEVVTDTENKASGAKYIEVKQGAGEGSKVGGSASYSFVVKEKGKFYLWARVWWLDSCGNSFSVALDGKKPFTFGNDNTYKSWHWVKFKVKIPLKAGEHTMVISNREDGIRVDEILFSSDRKFVPVEIEKPTVKK